MAAFREADYLLTLDGVEFADDIVRRMDLYRSGKLEPSLGDFVQQLRSSLTMWARNE